MRCHKELRSKRKAIAIRFDVGLASLVESAPLEVQDYLPKLKPLEPVRARADELELLGMRVLLTELTADWW